MAHNPFDQETDFPMELKELLVVISHSSIVIPGEIPLPSLSERFPLLLKNVDWYTDWLYDFRDLLDNRQVVFPYCSLILDANRHPDIIEDSVPLRDMHDEPVYRSGAEPDGRLRRTLAGKYLAPFNKAIEDYIVSGAGFLLDGHATLTARGVADDQIDLMNVQHSALDDEPCNFCPDIYIEAYAAELRKRLPEVRVTVNGSEYFSVYGHVCAQHSVNAMGRVGGRVPAILQETNQQLYMNPDNTPDMAAINRLRRIFAQSLYAACSAVRSLSEERDHDQPA